MSSDHPDTGQPAPSTQPVSTADAARLLNSLRQAERETAESSPAGDDETASGASAPAASPDSVASGAAASNAAESAVRAADSTAVESAVHAAASNAAESAVRAADSRVADSSAADAHEPVAGAAADPVGGVATRAASSTAASESVSADASAEYPAVEVSVTGSATEITGPDASDAPDAPYASDASVTPDAAADAESDAATSAPDRDESSIATGDFVLPGEVASDVETIVHVLRHGEVHNPKGILYGRLSGFGLSVTGQAQAQAVARSLRDHDIALVVASPLQRAQETADPIATQHGLLIRTDDNLIEAGNTFEGLRVAARDGALRKPRHWLKLRDPFTPSWGEPYLQIAHRMLAAVNKARVEAAGREAVLVSHQLPVWTLRRFLQGQRLWHDPRRRQCSLASLTSLVYQGDTLIDIVYSEPAGATDPTVTGA